jgi:carboxyl-terminal processing protease
VADALIATFGNDVRDRSDVPWDKPLVVLIDGRTRSAKEVFAHAIRSRRLGWLVGERTEGAVLGAAFHPLPDGSVLELPAMEVPVPGARLEGVGVAPHVRASCPLPYASGADPIFEAGCAVAIRAVRDGRRAPAVVGPF